MSRRHIRFAIAALLAALLLAGLSAGALAAEGGEDGGEPGETVTEPDPSPTSEPDPTPTPTPDPTPTPTPSVPPASEPPIITGDLPGTLAIPAGSSFTLSVTAVGDNLQYQWYKDGNQLPGQTGASLQVTGAEFAHAGRYFCYIQNSGDRDEP